MNRHDLSIDDPPFNFVALLYHFTSYTILSRLEYSPQPLPIPVVELIKPLTFHTFPGLTSLTGFALGWLVSSIVFTVYQLTTLILFA